MAECRRRADDGYCEDNVSKTVVTNRYTALNIFESMKIMLEWAFEQGINMSDVNHRDENILHETCAYRPTKALFLVGACEKYGLNQTVLAAMANVFDNNGKRPIDLVREGMSREMYKTSKKIGNTLIKKLEKYTIDNCL